MACQLVDTPLVSSVLCVFECENVRCAKIAVGIFEK